MGTSVSSSARASRAACIPPWGSDVPSAASLLIVAVLPDFPPLADVVAGDRVRSFELLTALADPRRRIQVRTLVAPAPVGEAWGAHLTVGALPIHPGRVTDVAAMATIARALRGHAAEA